MSDHSVDPRATQMNRRSFFRGVGLLVAAPAIVKVSSLMGMPRAPVELYGRSPGLTTIQDLIYYQNRLWVVTTDIIAWSEVVREVARVHGAEHMLVRP